jgi:DNA (cytosine-5)-methyltransferase 1
MENVFGLAYRNQAASWFERLGDGLRRLGYSVAYEVLNAADYGVPQNRQRFISDRRTQRSQAFSSAGNALG